MTTFRAMVALALDESIGRDVAITRADEIATSLERQFRANGVALHNTRDGRCIRMPAPEGREMTESEKRTVEL